jgi:hypothetical protein
LLLADLESAKAAAKSKAAKKNAARKAKKAAEEEAPCVASVTNGIAQTRWKRSSRCLVLLRAAACSRSNP